MRKSAALGLRPRSYCSCLHSPLVSLHQPVEPPQSLIDAFVCTFTELEPALIGALNRLLDNFEDARDAAQETFLKCWRARDEIPGVCDVRAWIFRIGWNTAKDLRRNAFRQRARPLSVIGISLKAYEPCPDEAAEQGEAEERLDHALLQLPLDEKEVFLLRRCQGWTYPQIAARRQRCESTVKSQMRAAVAKLRLLLRDE